jgi:hypothetical protein
VVKHSFVVVKAWEWAPVEVADEIDFVAAAEAVDIAVILAHSLDCKSIAWELLVVSH